MRPSLCTKADLALGSGLLKSGPRDTLPTRQGKLRTVTIAPSSHMMAVMLKTRSGIS